MVPNRCLSALLVIVAAPCVAAQPSVDARDLCVAERSIPPVFGCANRINLVGSVADRADLLHGRPSSRSFGALDASAIDRLLNDRVKPLAATTTDGSQSSPVPASSGVPQ